VIFDLFHSVSDPLISGKTLGTKSTFENFFSQVALAEQLPVDTVWLAESHFSSETQKKNRAGTIPYFHGEVGLNGDSFQWLLELAHRTKRLNFGTAIHNIVGGSGGPIASADRANTLRFINANFLELPRLFRLGVAAGRFSYQNDPFGITPRSDAEKDLWPLVRRFIFLEALEIFLRLFNGEELSSDRLKKNWLRADEVQSKLPSTASALLGKYVFPYLVEPRWNFESLKLVPENVSEGVKVVLGSADPDALDLALQFSDVDLFNLSFTPPDQLDRLHQKMFERFKTGTTAWHRTRLPRTVMVFIDPDPKKARERASFCLDAYIEAMRGTAAVPVKSVLLERALIGDAHEIIDQLSPRNPRRFSPDDRLMLWFEFNQPDGEAVLAQMKYFFEKVVPYL
jgi:alkanesulfonate monooxygenase SsuD/methylene tetrahydromethanopterin reductase-like flavin-dependent oxidoreductase (luciferase family)